MERFVVLTTCDSGPPEGPGCCGPLPPRLFLLSRRERAPLLDLNVKSRNISEVGVKLQAGSDVNRAVGYEYFTWTVDEHLQKKKKTLCVYIFHQAGVKWKSLCLHLEGIPDGGKNPASLSNVPLNSSLPPVISEESINSQSKEPTRRPDCVSSPPPPTPHHPTPAATTASKEKTGITHSCGPESFLLSVNPGSAEEVGKQEPEPGAPHPANSQSRSF